jgi:hypothetical protein
MGTVVIFGQTLRTSAETYRFTVDYFNFGPSGKFASKQRVAGEYRKNRDGTAEWTNVTTAQASSLEGDFDAPQRQA